MRQILFEFWRVVFLASIDWGAAQAGKGGLVRAQLILCNADTHPRAWPLIGHIRQYWPLIGSPWPPHSFPESDVRGNIPV